MNLLGNGYFNYLVSFSDGTFKTGITASPFYRLQDFIQEAHRHSVKVDGFEITPPSKLKITALKIETEFCNLYSFDAIEGHREWFKKNVSWADDEYQANFFTTYDHKQEFTYMHMDLNSLWNKRNPVYYSLLGKTSKERRERERSLREFREFASELGKCGTRIKAKLATTMANDILGEVLQ